MGQASLNGFAFSTDPEQIRWNFTMKTARQPTIGGQVIQILGATVSDMTVTGRFGAETSMEPWQEYDRFRTQIKRWVRALQADRSLTPLRFVFPVRHWDFPVYVKAFAPIQHANTNIAPTFQLTLFMADATNAIAKGVKDIYMARLMDGIGWKQTDYNGPTQADVDAMLGGMTPEEYLATQDQAAFDAGQAGHFGTANN